MVIWCAQIKEIEGSSIIGWYKDAIVYRTVIQGSPKGTCRKGPQGFDYAHNVEALAENCVLLPKHEILSGRWQSPRKNTHGFGFGQSNMWYANDESSQEYVQSVLEAIGHYSGENEIHFD